MYNVVQIIELINVLVLAITIILLFYKFNGRLHLYLMFFCVALLFNNFGYQAELMSTTLDTYLVAMKLSYAGRLWIGFALLLFVAELCRVKLPKWFPIVTVIFYAVVYTIIFDVDKNDLYYTYMDFEINEGFPIIRHGNGILYYAFAASVGIFILLACFWLARSYIREKNEIRKKQLSIVSLAMIIMIVFYVVEITHLLPITRKFDITAIGYTIGSIIFLIAILKYNLLNSADVARQFALDELASCSFIAFDGNGNVTYYNKPSKKLFPMIDKDKDTVINILEEHIELKEPIEIDNRLYVTRRERLGEEADNLGRIYLINDETDHFKYMEDLRIQKEIADDANKAKSNFLANMSHEIRSPINAILGMDEMIIRESSEEAVVGYASDIMTSSKTLLSIVNDILDFSKVEEGKMEIIPTEYEVGDMVSNLISMVSERIVDKGLKFVVKVDERIPRVLFGDEIRIKQCVLNLLTNALKYTMKGEIEFLVSYTELSDDMISLEFTVRDTGIGMKKEDLDKLFSPFTRIEERRNRKVEGTGLGMSITNKLLELMGTKLDVESVYGEGSKFSFEVEQKVISGEPVGDFYQKSMMARSELKSYKESFHAPDANLLVIDDTEINLSVIKNLLKKTEINIDTADSAKKGIELLRKNKYDLMLIDHMMPEMDGIEALHYMKDEGLVGDMKCVVLTANAVSGVREMYIGEGFDDYLSKPVNPDVLEQRLIEWLPDDKVVLGGESDTETDKDNNTGNTNSGANAVSETGTADNNPTEAKELADLSTIPELDTDTGVAYCGSKESYLSVIRIFHETAKDKADEIRTNYENKDWENFTVKVHALKSSARVIGAKELSEEARRMEEAGENVDTDTIDKNIEGLLKQFKDLDNKLTVLDKDDSELPVLTESMRKDAYDTMIEITNSMDYGMMESLLDDIDNYKLEKEDFERFKRIRKLLLELDWEGIEAELKTVQ